MKFSRSFVLFVTAAVMTASASPLPRGNTTKKTVSNGVRHVSQPVSLLCRWTPFSKWLQLRVEVQDMVTVEAEAILMVAVKSMPGGMVTPRTAVTRTIDVTSERGDMVTLRTVATPMTAVKKSLSLALSSLKPEGMAIPEDAVTLADAASLTPGGMVTRRTAVTRTIDVNSERGDMVTPRTVATPMTAVNLKPEGTAIPEDAVTLADAAR
ncbi:hypothetical protein K439DRAFT_1615269 [Ramaria rubella]|nr:hypothetical protein K439DRAFT_1615269 [Ramaria rubella]